MPGDYLIGHNAARKRVRIPAVAWNTNGDRTSLHSLTLHGFPSICPCVLHHYLILRLTAVLPFFLCCSFYCCSELGQPLGVHRVRHAAWGLGRIRSKFGVELRPSHPAAGCANVGQRKGLLQALPVQPPECLRLQHWRLGGLRTLHADSVARNQGGGMRGSPMLRREHNCCLQLLPPGKLGWAAPILNHQVLV